MLQVQVVSKEHHNVLENVQTNQVTLNEASVVVIHTTRENIQSAERVGNSLIIKTKDGQQLVIENYFSENPDLNDVVLEDNNKLYILETGDNAVGFLEINYNPIEEINPLLYSDTTAGLWAWLIPIATAGGILGWANNDSDSSSSPSNSSQLLDAAEKAVKAAEDANKAAKDALTDAQADGLITPEEKANLEQALADAKAAEDTAQKAVDALKDGTDKDGLQDRLDNLTDIVIPAVTDTDGNGIDDAVDAQIADAEAAVKAAEDAYQAAEDALEEANANGLITPTEKAALEEALQAAQDAKDAAQDAVDVLPSAPAAVQDAKDGFQDRIDALTDITIPAVNDANENGVDDSTENPVDLATDLVEAAEDAYQAAEDALTDANADGLITPEEKAALEDALKDAQDAKDAAQNAVDALPDSADKDALQDRIDALTDITVPAVTDTDGNGIDDAVDAQIADAEAAVKAAEDAYQAAEDALEEANANGLITPTEKAALEEALQAAQDAKDAAQDAVDALPSSPAAVQDAKDGFQDRIDALTDITIPAVNDANENGVDDSTENPVDLATDLVEAAEDAYQAAEDALTDANADGLITPEEQAALEDALKDAQDAKDAAQNAVDALPDSADKDALQDRLDNLTDIEIPAVTDTDGNGIDDAVDAQIADAEAAVKAAEDAYDAAADALAAALDNDGVYSQAEVDALSQNLADAQAAKDAAQDAVDALPSAPAAVQDAKDDFQDRINALTDIVIPAVNDADTDGNGIADVIDGLIADAEAAVKAAEDAYDAAADALAAALDNDGVYSQAEVDALSQNLADAQAAKDAAQDAVDALPSAPAAVQDAKDDFQDRINALTDIVIPAVNDADTDGNGIADVIDGLIADAEAAVKAAEDAYDAAADALAAALDNDGVYSQAEVDALSQNLADAQAAKDAAQDAVDALPSAPAAVQDAKDGLQDRIDALTDITIPAVNDADTDGNGIADVIDDLIADAEAAVKAAEDAYQAADDALKAALDNDGVYSQAEVDALTENLADAQAAKDAAQDAVDALPSAPAAVQDAKDGLQDRIDALTDITIPAVNDADTDGNGIADVIDDLIADAEAAVKAAEDAYQAADDALKAALDNDGVYSQAEVDALTENLADAQAAKDAAQDAVDALPSAPAAVQDAKDGLQDRLDALTDITIPAVNDADTDGNGIADVIDDLIADAEAAVKAAEDARIAQQEILENLTDANSNGVITPEEYAAAEAELAALQAIVDAAKDAAQEAVDALPSAPAAVQDAKGDFQDRIDAIEPLEIPAVTLLDAIDDEIELDLGSIETSPWDEVKEVSELAVIDLGLINNDAAGLEFSVPNKVSDQGKGHTGNVTITVSQSDLVAVASGFSVHVVQKQADGSWKTITVATVEDGLIADALGLDILGVVDDGNTVALELKNLPEGEYKAIVANDESAIRSLVDDLSLEELGENGILLGKDNQDAVLNAVEIALNGNFIGLGTAVKGVLAPLLLTADTLGVGQIVGAVTAIPLVKTLLGGVIDPILDAIADALVDNLISILKKTDITAIGEEIHFSNLELTNNVLENDISENTSTVIQINGVDVIAGVPTIVQGQYGSLSIESNGTFTYISNGLKESSGKSETFTYTISDGIRTDDANLIINIKDIVAPDAPIINPVNGEDTITGIDTYFMGTGADTVVFSMLVGAETDDTGGNGHDTWTDFSLTEDDRIDVNALLQDGLSKLATDSNYVGNYIKVNTSGNDTVIRIDRDGSATDSTYTETELLTLKNVNTTLQELLDNNQLLF